MPLDGVIVSSLLLSVVKGKLFSFWLVPPWLDLGFDYFLTYGQQADATRYLELRKHGEDNWLRLSGPNVNYQQSIRWQRLLRSVVSSDEEAGRACASFIKYNRLTDSDCRVLQHWNSILQLLYKNSL